MRTKADIYIFGLSTHEVLAERLGMLLSLTRSRVRPLFLSTAEKPPNIKEKELGI